MRKVNSEHIEQVIRHVEGEDMSRDLNRVADDMRVESEMPRDQEQGRKLMGYNLKVQKLS